MQEIAVTVFKTGRAQAGASRYSMPTVIEEAIPGRVHVAFIHDGKRRTALVQAESDWSVHMLVDGTDIYTCSFDDDRDTICVERFRREDVPRTRVLQGAERAQVLGAGFSTATPIDLAEAVKTAGF
jgi:hypothetical protein